MRLLLSDGGVIVALMEVELIVSGFEKWCKFSNSQNALSVLIVRNLLVQTDRVEAVVEDGQNEYFIWPSKSQFCFVSVTTDYFLDRISKLKNTSKE